MLELFNVREAQSKKILAGPFQKKSDAKAARNKLDPESAAKDVTDRSNYFSVVVTYGQDHHLYGLKNKQTQKGGGKKSDAASKKTKNKK